MTERLGLLFLEQTDELPGPPIAHVYVKGGFAHEYPGVDPRLVLLTTREFGLPGILQQIAVLEQELKTLKAQARREYADWRGRQK